jgi:5'-deoxynucleotidase YfbR-like HD superfamily hydrolase
LFCFLFRTLMHNGKGKLMKNIANLLFKAKILKDIPRSGYQFLGAGQESVAEHSFGTAFIAYVMSQLEPDIDALRLISMCLVHDLPEAKTGDLNYVQKKYVTADENKAVADLTRNLPFGAALAGLLQEFNEGRTLEAKLARDADQLAFIIELKALADIGLHPPNKWLPFVCRRLQTETGRRLAQHVMETDRDAWWLEKFSEPHQH